MRRVGEGIFPGGLRVEQLGIDDVLDILAIDLLGVVPEDEEVIVATNKGRPLALENRARAGQAFNNIARRLLGEDVPLMSLQKESLITRVRRFFVS